MAGSLAYFKYRNDAGIDYSVNIDESNAEAAVGGIALCLPRTAAHPFLPCKVRKRYLLAYNQAEPDFKRKFWIGNPLAIPQILASSTFTAAVGVSPTDGAPTTGTWVITRYVGEKQPIVPPLAAFDTGLVDGDI